MPLHDPELSEALAALPVGFFLVEEGNEPRPLDRRARAALASVAGLAALTVRTRQLSRRGPVSLREASGLLLLAAPLRGLDGSVVAVARCPSERPLLSRDELAARLGISPREAQVATLAAEGCTNQEIAARLTISISTVKAHLRRVYAETRLASRQELAARITAISLRLGRLEPLGGGGPQPGGDAA